jgi:hypothetical protein
MQIAFSPERSRRGRISYPPDRKQDGKKGKKQAEGK